MIRLALAGVAVALVMAATPVSAEPTLEARVLARVNHYRAENQLAPLSADASLAAAALAHARDMVEQDFFAHGGSDGANSGIRARRAGYGWRAVGENIAAGLSSPEGTVDQWMASEGHRRNMLNPIFRDAGIGHVYRAEDGGKIRYRHYWVLVLAAAPKRSD